MMNLLLVKFLGFRMCQRVFVFHSTKMNVFAATRKRFEPAFQTEQNFLLTSSLGLKTNKLFQEIKTILRQRKWVSWLSFKPHLHQHFIISHFMLLPPPRSDPLFVLTFVRDERRRTTLLAELEISWKYLKVLPAICFLLISCILFCSYTTEKGVVQSLSVLLNKTLGGKTEMI